MCVSGIKKFYLYGKFCTRTKSTRPHSSWSMKHSICQKYFTKLSRGTSRTPVSSKMEFFVTLVNGWKSLIKLKESSILDVKGVLDTPLVIRKSRRTYRKMVSSKILKHVLKIHFHVFVDIHRMESTLIRFQHICSFCLLTDAGFHHVSNINCLFKLFLPRWLKYVIFSMSSPYFRMVMFCIRLHLSPYLSSQQNCLFRMLCNAISR